MSAYSASSPSMDHTCWYLIRPPSLACPCRNDTSCDSVAAYSFTGTLTSPKDTAPFQIARISYLRELVHFVPVSTSNASNARAKRVTALCTVQSAQPLGQLVHGRHPAGG